MAEATDMPALSEAQMEIMNAVWDRGEATVAEVWKALSARRSVARNTVLTTMERLRERGWLHCESGEHAFRYRAAAPREAVQGMMVRRLLDSAFAGSAEGLVMALLDGRGLSAGEAKRVRDLIRRADDERAKGKGKEKGKGGRR
jgi:BlaI family transcriptional regulator, penicillinase repressor